MPLTRSRTRVKICGLTRASDVVAAVELGADALGFVFFEKSARHLQPEQAAALANQVPAFVTRVALFLNPGRDYVAQILQRVPVDLLQFHGTEDAVFCRSFERPYIKAVPMKDFLADAPSAPLLETRMRDFFADHADARGFLLDSNAGGEAGGSGEHFDWASLAGGLSARLGVPLIVAGGLEPQNVAQAIRLIRPFAVDVSSGVECAPGVKDNVKLSDFFHAVAEADRADGQ